MPPPLISSAHGYTYLLTCVDRYTRWPEAIPLSTITSEVVARAFISGWISRFGVPSTIVTDCGRQFESHLWSNLMALLGTKRSRTTSYHPQANGMVERFHRQLKAALKAQPNPDVWMTRHQNCSQARSQFYCSRNGLWHHSSVTWRILHPISTQFATRPLRIPQHLKSSFPTGQTNFTSTDHYKCQHPAKPIHSNACFRPPRCSSQTPL